jgi:hypothetical protein
MNLRHNIERIQAAVMELDGRGRVVPKSESTPAVFSRPSPNDILLGRGKPVSFFLFLFLFSFYFVLLISCFLIVSFKSRTIKQVPKLAWE